MFGDSDTTEFFATPSLPCPYLPGRFERKVFIELRGKRSNEIHNQLAKAGFRRSQGIVYRPLCDGCKACVPVRVLAENFKPKKWMRRIISKTANIRVEEFSPSATAEQFTVFQKYLMRRHSKGSMMGMDFCEFKAMIEDTPGPTSIIEFRDPDGALAGACLTDVLSDGLSMVYSFYDPELENLSMGSAIILWHLRKAAESGLKYVYLGYWIEESKKMAYKIRFTPIEALQSEGWMILKA